MTIQEYKAKLDSYLGMIGELESLSQGYEDEWSESYRISYFAPSGVPIANYRIVRSKIHPMPYGWYESGSRTEPLPDLDPHTIENKENFRKKMKEAKWTS